MKTASRWLSSDFFEAYQIRYAVKVGVSASLGLFLGIGFSQVLDRPDTIVSGMWTVLTAIVVVQAHLGGTYIAALLRFLGTLVGTIVAGISITFFGSNAISLGFSVFATVILCAFLRLKEGMRIASITVAILTVLWGLRPDISPWIFGLFRFLDSCLGIFIAVVVTHTLWPEQATSRVRLNIVFVLKLLKKLYRQCLIQPGYPDKERDSCTEKLMREVVDHIRQTRVDLEGSRLEIRTRSSIQDWHFLVEHLERAYEAIVSLRQVSKNPMPKQLFDKTFSKTTQDAMEKIEQTIGQLAKILEKREDIGKPIDLLRSLELLDDEFIQLSESEKIGTFHIKEVQNFFVFFYGIRTLADELLKLDHRVHTLYG